MRSYLRRMFGGLIFLVGLLLSAGQGSEAQENGFKEVEALAKEEKVAQAKAAETKKAQDDAYQAYLDAKKKLQDAERPQIDQPKVSPAVLVQLKQTYQEAAKSVTEKTLAATQAEKDLRHIQAQKAAVQAAQKKPPTDGPATSHSVPNALSRLQLKLGPTYDYVEQHLKPILDKFKGLPLPALVRPGQRSDPFETQWKKYQDAYDSTQPPAIIVQKPPDQPKAPDQPKPPPAGELEKFQTALATFESAVAEHNRDVMRFKQVLAAFRAEEAAHVANMQQYNAAAQAFNALPSHLRTQAERERLSRWLNEVDAREAALKRRFVEELTPWRSRLIARKRMLDAQRADLISRGQQLNLSVNPGVPLGVGT